MQWSWSAQIPTFAVRTKYSLAISLQWLWTLLVAQQICNVSASEKIQLQRNECLYTPWCQSTLSILTLLKKCAWHDYQKDRNCTLFYIKLDSDMANCRKLKFLTLFLHFFGRINIFAIFAHDTTAFSYIIFSHWHLPN